MKKLEITEVEMIATKEKEATVPISTELNGLNVREFMLWLCCLEIEDLETLLPHHSQEWCGKMHELLRESPTGFLAKLDMKNLRIISDTIIHRMRHPLHYRRRLDALGSPTGVLDDGQAGDRGDGVTGRQR